MAQTETVLPEGEMDEATENLLTTEFDDLIEKYDPKAHPVYVAPTLVTREKWGAVPPKHREPLCTPVQTVLLLDTRSEFCTCEETCGIVLRKLQKYYMDEKGLPDIPWNFMIGEDGKIYEGRGWVTNGSKTLPETEKFHCATLDIAYIGNYQAKIPSKIMTYAYHEILGIGTHKGVVDMNYDAKSELLNDFVEETIIKPKTTGN